VIEGDRTELKPSWNLFFSCYAAKRLALQLHQERSQVMCGNEEARKCLTDSNGTPAVDIGLGTDHVHRT